jgi:DNA (cytosine-5)-methyltransferase 1
MHLFAGAGGGLLADLILGHTPVAAVEWDAYCCQVLRERAEEWFPGLRVHEGDVRLFDPSEYAGRVDCIHAGFPCQDISRAGRQAGVGEETRSGLYREVLRVASLVRPRKLFLENVSAILGNGHGTVLGDLAALGYDSRWVCLRASDCGAPHLRDRWWLMADARCPGQKAARDDEKHGPPHSSWQADWFGGGSEVFPYADTPRLQKRQLFAGVQSQARCDDDWEDAPLGDWWESEPDVGRVANGVASRVDRLKALGNGQVPLQAALAWRILTGG